MRGAGIVFPRGRIISIPSTVIPLLVLSGVVPSLTAQTIHGKVTDATTGRPVGAVAVGLVDAGGAVVARAASYRVRFLVPGYQAMLSEAVRLAQGDDVALSPKLRPLTAFAPDTVVVRGERVPRYLEDFYERRGKGFGTFLTQQ